VLARSQQRPPRPLLTRSSLPGGHDSNMPTAVRIGGRSVECQIARKVPTVLRPDIIRCCIRL